PNGAEDRSRPQRVGLAFVDTCGAASSLAPAESGRTTRHLEGARKHPSKTRGRTSPSFKIEETSGEILFLKKQYDEALQVLSAQAENGKDKAEYFNLLGMCHAELNQFPEAAQAVEKAIALEGGRSLYYFNLASIYQRAGDNQSAVKILERALARDPDSPDS